MKRVLTCMRLAPYILDGLLALLLALTFFVIVRTSTVRAANYHTRSDPRGTLLTSQALWQYGTPRLDAFGTFDELEASYRYRVRQYGPHVYYYFPIGTPLVAVPFVALAQCFGKDMNVQYYDAALQGLLAAVSVSVISVLSFLLARMRLRRLDSLVLSGLFVGGSTLASTCGTALWSFNFQIVFILLSLILLLHVIDRGINVLSSAAVLGVCVFVAYLCRPSSLVFALGCPCLLGLLRRYRAALTVSAVMVACLAAFMVWSMIEYSMILPPYYQLSRIGSTGSFRDALLGNLFSPSRGLFVFSPHFAVAIVMGIATLRREFFLASFALGWATLNVVAVSSFPHWWGGHSYGPRLLTDSVPAIFLVAVVALSHLRGRAAVVTRGAIVAFGAAAILIHSGQGLYNRSTLRWNYYPDVDKFPEYVFDWRCPQFLATDTRLEKRMERHERELEPNQSIEGTK